jgi:hypothetical protein
VDFECELNISYGDSPRQKIDLFGKNLPGEFVRFPFRSPSIQLHGISIKNHIYLKIVETDRKDIRKCQK